MVENVFYCRLQECFRCPQISVQTFIKKISKYLKFRLADFSPLKDSFLLSSVEWKLKNKIIHQNRPKLFAASPLNGESFIIFLIYNGWPSPKLSLTFKAELGGSKWVWSVSSSQLKHAVVKWVQDSLTEGSREDRDRIQRKWKASAIEKWKWRDRGRPFIKATTWISHISLIDSRK